MVLYEIIWTISRMFNPLLFIPNFFNYTYPYFFISNLFFFIFLFIKNKSLLKYLYAIIKKTSKFTLSILFLIAAFHLINCIYSTEPLNNLTYSGYLEIFNADDLYHEQYFTHLEVPLGWATLLFIIRSLTNIDYIYIISALGILLSILTIFTLFLIIKHLTKKDTIAVLGCLFYILISDVVFYSTKAGSNVISSFFILLLLLLYITHSSNINNIRCILFCSTLLVFFRLENLAYLAVVAGFLLINKIKNLRISDYIIAYLFFLPHTVLLASNRFELSISWQATQYLNQSFTNLGGIFLRLVSFYGWFNDNFSKSFLLLLLIGIFYLLIKKKWAGVLTFFALFCAYLIWPKYPGLQSRYIFSLVPVIIVFIIMGFYTIYNFINYPVVRILWKILLVFLFCVTIVFGLSHHFFTKFDKDVFYVKYNEQAGNLLQDSRVILYGDPIEVNPFRRFYNDYEVVYNYDPSAIMQYDINSYDYLVHLVEWVSNQSQVEKALGLNLELTYNTDGHVHVYKIIH